MTDDTRRIRQALLEAMRDPGYVPGDFAALEKRLDLGRARHRVFRRAFRELLEEGLIRRLDRRRYALADAPFTREPPGRRAPHLPRAGAAARHRHEPSPTRKGPAVPARAGSAVGAAPHGPTGLLQINPRGFGFVTLDQGGPDLFIPPGEIGDLRDGDRVEVAVTRTSSDGRLQGRIVRLVERTRRRVVGVFRAAHAAGASPGGRRPGGRGAAGIVEAYDRRHEGGIVIPPGEIGGAVDGLVVGVEILTPPTALRPATGRVVEVIGPEATSESELRAVILKYGLREEFPPDVMAEAERAPEAIGAADRSGREDFRDLPIVTIDGETARDFDDAILVQRTAGGGWELQVHIADVAHYVGAGTALDQEAFERGTSVYFPGSSLPMLPHRLSNGICSLNPHVERLVLSCVMTLDPHGRVVDHRLVEGVIRSAARMTYTDVAKILVQRDPEVMERHRDLVPHFQAMETLCGLLNARRRRRGSIDFDLPEPEVILAATGEMTGIKALVRNIAHRIIEEFMLIANETVAAHLSKARMPAIYRVHERPDPRRLEEFDKLAGAFGYHLPRPFTSIQPAAFQALLDRAEGRPEEPFLAKQMLRSMKQARYSERRDLHFGLASSCYTHFTSPIRRYPDLIVHRLVKRLLHGGPLSPRERDDWEAFLPEAAARSSFRERAADAAENELIERKKMAFMAGKVGETFEGFVGRVEPFGFFVELADLFVEGLVPVESLAGDRFNYDERRRVLRGERRGQVFALGDPVRVRLARVDTARLEIVFVLLEARTGPRPAGPIRAAAPAPGRDRHARPQAGRSEGRRGRRNRRRSGGGQHAADRPAGHAGGRRGRRRRR